jgi:hypothetical protein
MLANFPSWSLGMTEKRTPSAKRFAALPITLIASHSDPAETKERAAEAVMKIATLVARQIAREEFARRVTEESNQRVELQTRTAVRPTRRRM